MPITVATSPEDFKSVNGVKCQKAITQENDNTIIAWFTQNPKYNRLGPEHYGMEGALIMELKTPFFTFLAAEIETNDQVLDFHKPEHGELVNLEKYRKVEKAFFAKMGIMGFKK